MSNFEPYHREKHLFFRVRISSVVNVAMIINTIKQNIAVTKGNTEFVNNTTKMSGRRNQKQKENDLKKNEEKVNHYN